MFSGDEGEEERGAAVRRGPQQSERADDDQRQLVGREGQAGTGVLCPAG